MPPASPALSSTSSRPLPPRKHSGRCPKVDASSRRGNFLPKQNREEPSRREQVLDTLVGRPGAGTNVDAAGEADAVEHLALTGHADRLAGARSRCIGQTATGPESNFAQ